MAKLKVHDVTKKLKDSNPKPSKKKNPFVDGQIFRKQDAEMIHKLKKLKKQME